VVAASSRQVMLWVLIALLPGSVAMSYFYGTSYLVNVTVALLAGLASEAACLALRRAPLSQLGDGSAAVTAILLALALPPNVPIAVVLVAVVSAISLAKHLYGGLGHNLFNPAMVGYAIVLISFPADLALWPSPTDANTGATALVSMRFRDGLTVAEAWRPEQGFGLVGDFSWEWINLAFLGGGLLLCLKGFAAWRVPAAMLATLGAFALVTYDGGSSASAGSPMFHWFSGATMLAAFFFATDPVTHPISHRGQLIFGAIVGAMTFVVRAYGNYPDGLAFGILLANALTPFLDKRLAAVRA